jgi:succinate-semialdehyde dehydrogenase/glutarate-semialdehyde dehydrogenase
MAAVDLGPMCTKNGLQIVKKQVADELSKGAQLMCGGKAPTGEQFEKAITIYPPC